MAIDVKFLRGTQAEYNTKAASASGVDNKNFYYTTDEGNVYLGAHQLNNDALDVPEFALGSVSGSILTLSGIKQVDGKIAAGTDSTKNITLAKVAMTGAAADVSYNGTIGETTVTNVDDAIGALAAASSGGVASKTIWGHDDSAGQSDYAKVYKIYQGENDYVANRTDGKINPDLKLTINIPKDKVLEDANIVDITFNNGSLYDNGTDVTTLIKGSGTATEADAGKYLKMVMQNVTDPLYVNLQTFVDVYTVEQNATEVQLDITNHEISASIVSVDGSKVIYKAETSQGAGDGETVKQALTRLDGADSVTGSVSKKIKDAIDALDAVADSTKTAIDGSTDRTAQNGGVFALQALTEADGKLASMTAVEVEAAGTAASAIADLDVAEFPLATVSGSIVTIGGLVETDGKVAAGSNAVNSVTLAKIAKTGKAEDAALSSATGAKFTSATDTDAALSEIATALTWGSL